MDSTCITDAQMFEHCVDVLMHTDRFQRQDAIQTKVCSLLVYHSHCQEIYFEENSIRFSF